MRPLRALTLLATLAAAGALSLLAGGCGSSAVTLDPVAQAAALTTRGAGAHLAVTVQVSAAQLASPMTITGEGFFNYRSAEGKLSVQASGLPSSALAQLPPGPVTIEEIFKSSSIYVGSPLLAGRLPGGARWIKLDLGRLSQALGLNVQQLSSGQSNPAQLLELLRASGGATVRVGSEDVRGVPTTRYRGSIELDRVASVVRAGQAAQVRAALQKLIAQAGTSSIPVEVWIDRHQLVRRVSLAITLAGAPGKPQVDVTVELFGFGPTPVVTPPPASEVFDVTQTTLSALSAAGG